MDLQLNDARVLVTAGASGIGLATARAFVREGARVHVCDVDKGALDALATSDATLTRSVCDVADRAAVVRLFEEAPRTLGGLDVLVNNAGIAGPTARCEEIDPADWARTLDVNITGQFHCAQLAIPHLRRSKNASITNLSSAAGRFGFPLRTPYAASKWAVIGLTKSLSIELGDGGAQLVVARDDRAPSIEQLIEPSQTGGRAMRRPIFAADPAVVFEIVEQPEQIFVIDLADVGLVSPRHTGNLNVSDVRQPASDLLGQIAFDDLCVVEVHLHFEIGRADFRADRVCLGLRRQQVVRHVPRIQRFDQYRHTLAGRFGARKAQIARVRP